MKLYAWLHREGWVFFSDKPDPKPVNFTMDGAALLGTVDLPIEKPKKMVTKIVMATSTSGDASVQTFVFPLGATNIKCTYDIEE